MYVTLLKTPQLHKMSQKFYAIIVLSVSGVRGISRSLNHSLKIFFTQKMRHYGIVFSQLGHHHYDTSSEIMLKVTGKAQKP